MNERKRILTTTDLYTFTKQYEADVDLFLIFGDALSKSGFQFNAVLDAWERQEASRIPEGHAGR